MQPDEERLVPTPLGRFRLGLALIFVAGTAMIASVRWGSIVRTDSGQLISFSFSGQTQVLASAAAVSLLASSALIVSARIGWRRVFAVPVLALFGLCAWGAWLVTATRVEIRADHLMLPGYGSAVVTVAHADLEGVLIIEPGDASGDGAQAELVLYRQGASEIHVPMGDLMRAAWVDVSESLERRGVPVADMR